MNFTQKMKQKPNWGLVIRKKRAKLKESQSAFGARFGVTHAAVSDWERNVNLPPGDVTWWLYQVMIKALKK